MSLYTESYLQGLRSKVTTFRAEGGYITFYRESDYTLGKLRSQMTPLGTYLFINGITISETIAEHPAQQSFGSDYENLTAFAVVRSSVSINGLYTQEGADPAWMAPGHTPLLAFIDFFMPQNLQANDVANANGDLVQTLVARNLRVSSKTITSSDAAGVTYALAFNGGRVTRLANNTMDLP
jgi:hypothetical protein